MFLKTAALSKTSTNYNFALNSKIVFETYFN